MKKILCYYYNCVNVFMVVDVMYLDYIIKFWEMKRYGMWIFVYYIFLLINIVNI